jgi:glycosyltransferase involved in cell wall biosynthesis
MALNVVYSGLPPLHVIHNATAVEPTDTPKEELVLSVGRWWDPGKNDAILDEAAAIIQWPVMLAGPLEGPNGQAVSFLNTRTLGALPHQDVLNLMRRAAIFAAPSRYEPFGLAVVEAAIVGAALVLADIPTFRELWSDAALSRHPTTAWAGPEPWPRWQTMRICENGCRRNQEPALGSSTWRGSRRSFMRSTPR